MTTTVEAIRSPEPPSAIDEMPRVMGDDGEFHATDEAVDFRGTPWEAWVALAFFWALGLTVFYQFATRYLLNDSAAWTEEIGRYLLVATVFVGAAIGVAKNNHIQVDFFYRYMKGRVGRVLSLVVDVLRVAFFGTAAVLSFELMQKLGANPMTVIDLPMNIVYGVVLFGFAAMFVRSIWVLRVHLRRGYSVLQRPESTMDDR